MNLAQLWQSIYSRLTGDATLVAAVQGFFNVVAPPNLVSFAASGRPYVVFSIAASNHDDAFSVDIVEHTIRFSIIANGRSGLSVPAAIIKRIYGDAMKQVTRVPSYGLHRHKLVIPTAGEASEWAGGYIQHVDSAQDHTTDIYHFIETFRVMTSLAAPTS